jgi:hypothetical protein
LVTEHRATEGFARKDPCAARPRPELVADGTLQPRARGVASLLALDADDFAAAQDLFAAALAVEPDQDEALVAAASAVLARGDASRPTEFLRLADTRR